MKMNFAKLLFCWWTVALLLVSGMTVEAQQPQSPQAPAPTTTPIPVVDPGTMSPEQIKQAIEQRNVEQKNIEGTKQDKENIDQKNTDDNPDKDKKDDLEKQEKNDAGVKEEPGLPIFGNDIFNGAGSNFAPSNDRPTPVNYILGPGDKLNIDITGNSVVSWELTVAPDGSILLPGMGKLYLGGKTIENGTKSIEDKLRANRFAIGNGTNVSVSLTNIRTIRITVMGEVRNPGDKNVSSLTTVFNALYESGGITKTGTYRAIEVVRNNELIARIDMYDYLLRGDMSSNIQLRDGDVIRVPEYRVRVSIEGEVKRNAYYEVLPGESLKDVINFSGGFSDYAYKFNIKAIQVTDREQRLKDIPESEIESYIPLKGDKYTVSRILDRYENRVTIVGSVYRPGEYELSDGLTLKELIARADGLKEEAYQERGYITRLGKDNSSEIVPFYVKAIIDGTEPDIILKREDVINISSMFDYTDAFTVTINGGIRNGGTFPFFNGMTVEDLILKGGGFAEGADMQQVQIARRVKDSDRKAKDARLVQLITVNIDAKLKLTESGFKLEPHDVVSVFALPGYVKVQVVKVEGEVMRPGYYAMVKKDERISDVINRAGGFTAYAYLNGASLKRGDLIETTTDAEKQAIKVQQFENQQIDASNGQLGVNLADKTVRNNFVGIDLVNIIKKPRGSKDLILLDKDIINVPRELQTVKVSGEVFNPITSVYSNNMNLKDYVNSSGGFTQDAIKRKAYVVYANGSTKATKHPFLIFRNYPKIEPGAEVFIPKKKDNPNKFDPQTWIGLGTSMASLAAVVFGIISINNNK